MSQVSPRNLDSKVADQIYNTFLSAISDLTTPSSTRTFLTDLLSDSEIAMLGKRLSIAYMLQKGYTTRQISQTLKVSLTTINRISPKLSQPNSGYRIVISRMLQQEKIVAFFNKLEEKIDHALPPRGANWKQHYKRASKMRQKNKKAF